MQDVPLSPLAFGESALSRRRERGFPWRDLGNLRNLQTREIRSPVWELGGTVINTSEMEGRAGRREIDRSLGGPVNVQKHRTNCSTHLGEAALAASRARCVRLAAEGPWRTVACSPPLAASSTCVSRWYGSHIKSPREASHPRRR